MSLCSSATRRLPPHLILLLFVLPVAAIAQERAVPSTMTILRAADYDAFTFVPSPVAPSPAAPSAAPGKRAPARTAEIEVTYIGFPPEVEAAFAYAVAIWETLIDSPVPIRVRATWEPLEPRVLGAAGPQLIANFPLAPVENTWYPSALAEALAGRDFTEEEPDLFASFNSDLGLWYFGLDGAAPAGTYDFVTVVLHEIGHGLGFTGSFKVDDGAPDPDECPQGPTGYGCWGIGSQRFPIIFDRFTQDDREIDLLNTAIYPNPSLDLARVLQSDAVFFTGVAALSANRDIPIDLYAPENFDLGSSYSHLDENIFPAGDLNSLMTPQLARSEAIHSPGPITCGLFRDIGWPLAEGCLVLLDLGLASFDVETSGDDAVVEWLAFDAAETDRFEVQRRFFDDPFETVAIVPGVAADDLSEQFTYRAYDLPPGWHTFRLRQVMEDGRVFFSPEVTVFVEVPGEFFLSHAFPNPFTAQTHVYLLTDETEAVAVNVYDVSGRLVERLFDGILPAQERLVLTFEAAGLASGVYFIHVNAESFEETQSAVFVR